MSFFALGPEAAGDLGNACEHGDITERPVRIFKPDFEFQFWPHDDLLDGFYTYACSRRLAEALSQSNLNGYELDKLNVSFEERFHEWAELHKDEELPEFLWLKVSGRAGVDDFGEIMGPAPKSLVVSEQALQLLKQFKLTHCEIETYIPQELSTTGCVRSMRFSIPNGITKSLVETPQVVPA
ncbi:MAG: hypothetical protein WC028_14165 [Candidatus Obscuribacterales bacterium]